MNQEIQNGVINENVNETIPSVIPVAPTEQITPVAPVEPVTPTEPIAPVAPVEPVAPIEPIATPESVSVNNFDNNINSFVEEIPVTEPIQPVVEPVVEADPVFEPVVDAPAPLTQDDIVTSSGVEEVVPVDEVGNANNFTLDYNKLYNIETPSEEATTPNVNSVSAVAQQTVMEVNPMTNNFSIGDIQVADTNLQSTNTDITTAAAPSFEEPTVVDPDDLLESISTPLIEETPSVPENLVSIDISEPENLPVSNISSEPKEITNNNDNITQGININNNQNMVEPGIQINPFVNESDGMLRGGINALTSHDDIYQNDMMNNQMNMGMPNNMMGNQMNMGMPNNMMGNQMNMGMPNNMMNNQMNMGMPNNMMGNQMNMGMPNNMMGNQMNMGMPNNMIGNQMNMGMPNNMMNNQMNMGMPNNMMGNQMNMGMTNNMMNNQMNMGMPNNMMNNQMNNNMQNNMMGNSEAVFGNNILRENEDNRASMISEQRGQDLPKGKFIVQDDNKYAIPKSEVPYVEQPTNPELIANPMSIFGANSSGIRPTSAEAMNMGNNNQAIMNNMQQKKCPKCGFIVKEGQPVCVVCGFKL